MGLDRAECGMAIQQINILAALIEDMPLEELLRQAEREESTGPVLDPTLYREKGQDLRDVKKLVRPLIRFREQARAIEKRKKGGV